MKTTAGDHNSQHDKTTDTAKDGKQAEDDLEIQARERRREDQAGEARPADQKPETPDLKIKPETVDVKTHVQRKGSFDKHGSCATDEKDLATLVRRQGHLRQQKNRAQTLLAATDLTRGQLHAAFILTHAAFKDKKFISAADGSDLIHSEDDTTQVKRPRWSRLDPGDASVIEWYDVCTCVVSHTRQQFLITCDLSYDRNGKTKDPRCPRYSSGSTAPDLCR